MLWEDESWLISEIVAELDAGLYFESVGEVVHRGQAVQQEVAHAEIVLDRPHTACENGKKHTVSGRPLPLRLVVFRLVDDDDSIVARWTLLTKVDSSEVSPETIAFWCYRR